MFGLNVLCEMCARACLGSPYLPFGLVSTTLCVLLDLTFSVFFNLSQLVGQDVIFPRGAIVQRLIFFTVSQLRLVFLSQCGVSFFCSHSLDPVLPSFVSSRCPKTKAQRKENSRWSGNFSFQEGETSQLERPSSQLTEERIEEWNYSSLSYSPR